MGCRENTSSNSKISTKKHLQTSSKVRNNLMLFFKEITNEQIGMITEEKSTTDQRKINERLERQWEISPKLTTKN